MIKFVFEDGTIHISEFSDTAPLGVCTLEEKAWSTPCIACEILGYWP